jgi:hypothetical protein
VKNEVLRLFQEEKSILPKIISRKVKWIGSVLRMNCLIEGEIERTGRRRKIRIRRRKRRRRRRKKKKKKKEEGRRRKKKKKKL